MRNIFLVQRLPGSYDNLIEKTRFLVSSGLATDELLTQERLTHAEYYMRFSELSLQEIALRVGFQNPASFIR